MPIEAAAELAFDAICKAAAAGERAPANGVHNISADTLRLLAQHGRIKVIGYAGHWRTIHVLAGDMMGKRTALPPGNPSPIYMLDRRGMRRRKKPRLQ